MTTLTLTLEEIISEAFTAKNYPSSQDIDEGQIPADGESEIFATLSIAQANLYHWLHQLSKQCTAIVGTAQKYSDLSPMRKKEFNNLCETIIKLTDLMWTLIRLQFPQGKNPVIFRRMTILPSWKVAGVYLNDEEKHQQEHEHRMQQDLMEMFST